MRTFEEFIRTNDVRHASRDLPLAQALIKDAEKRVEIVLSANLLERSTVISFEQIYEALRECAEAILALEGYKSYSHVATIAFLQKCAEFSVSDIQKLDRAREKRNLSRYYAKEPTKEEVQEVMMLYHELKPRFDAVTKRLLLLDGQNERK